jgi:ABC-type Na+ efflux pump permease subunit
LKTNKIGERMSQNNQNGYAPSSEDSWKDSRENLRTEYQTCQQSANNETSGYWAFAGMFVALSIVLLAAVISVLFNHYKNLGILVTFLTIGMWITYISLFAMLYRANKAQDKLFSRMMDIDKSTNMKMRQLQNDKHGFPGWAWYGIILLTLGILWIIVLILALV